MSRKKNVIPVERRLVLALNHLQQAERHVNAVTISGKSVTEPIEEAKKKLIGVIARLDKRE
jgi:hypothetical protein